ncbi:MAG TPA: biopolymer transporter ExbD [Pyrinomonadaceae bacterium]|nr:biopolymer transporter ExbD [Pyrinomonadaceae bacterium]
MTKKIATGFRAQRIPAAAAIMLLLALAASCAQKSTTTPPQTQKQTPPQVQQTPPPQPAKITLNGEEMGTTADLSGLEQFLKKVMQGREKQGVIREGTDEIERTVFVRVEPSLKLAEVLKVIQAVTEAGASPVKLPVRANVKDDERVMPKLTLAVSVGEVKPEVGDFLDGMPIRYLQNSPVSREEKDFLGETYITIEMRRDGEYIVNEKPVAKSALSGELQARLKEPKDKILLVLVEKDSQISYASLADVAQAAFDAHAEGLQLNTLAP